MLIRCESTMPHGGTGSGQRTSHRCLFPTKYSTPSRCEPPGRSSSISGSQPPAMRYFTYAYDCAFKALWNTALAETKRHGRSPQLSPFLFLCRQSIELWLKAALDAFEPSEPPPEGHDLEHLWQMLLAALDNASQPTDDSFTASVGLALETIGVHDARGDRFRYPTARNASPYPETAADLA